MSYRNQYVVAGNKSRTRVANGWMTFVFFSLQFSDSIPGVGGGSKDDDDVSKEDQVEQERMRQEAIKQAEKERRDKYKKQEDERESLRQGIRDKV